MRPAGAENLGRLKSSLRRNAPAMSALRELGLRAATVDRLHLGLRDSYRGRRDGRLVSDAVCYPLLTEGERAIGRYAYLNLPGVTRNPLRPATWGPGSPNVYRLGSYAADAVAVIAADVVDCWRAWQLSAGGSPECAFLSRSHAEGWPPEWSDASFWASFSRVVLLPGEGAEDFLLDVATRLDLRPERVRLPPPHENLATLAEGCTPADFEALLAAAETTGAELVTEALGSGETPLGRFEAAAVRVTGAVREGYAYYPFRLERRSREDGGRGGASRVVHRYETVVLRSDGHVLASEVLPAPRGTPAAERVLALSDGTRIVDPPAAAGAGTWSHASIERFVAWRTRGGEPPFRSFDLMLADVIACLEASVWLPGEGAHLACALYVALSHVFQVFDAIPLLLVTGPPGSGKSELGEAVARLSFNATVAGQLRAAGMIRLLDETRGLLVLDDMDGGGQASVIGSGELAQAMKTSYKRSTSVKPLADRGGRVRMVDFFGPKLITNTRSVDTVLAARMICVRTEEVPPGTTELTQRSDVELEALRDELHCWGLASAAQLRERATASPPATCRRDEISAPLRLLASLAGVETAARLERFLSDPSSIAPPLVS